MVLEIFFAAGCFWGVEKNFESIEGVVDVVSGYSGGSYEDPTYEDVLKNRRIQSEGFLSVLKNIGLSDEEKTKDLRQDNRPSSSKFVKIRFFCVSSNLICFFNSAILIILQFFQNEYRYSSFYLLQIR